MGLELSSIPLAFIAGVISILSPCVWPLLPIVMSSAAKEQRFGPIYLALGLSTSFALAGGLLTLLLLNIGADPESLRWISAALMLLVGVTLVNKTLADKVSQILSGLSSRLNALSSGRGESLGQFGLGFMLGFVWLPCVGPTLGAAIALASLGQDLVMSFIVMFSYGIGTAAILLFAGFASNRVLKAFKGESFIRFMALKQVLGGLLITLSVLVLLGLDKKMEAFALTILPSWVTGL